MTRFETNNFDLKSNFSLSKVQKGFFHIASLSGSSEDVDTCWSIILASFSGNQTLFSAPTNKINLLTGHCKIREAKLDFFHLSTVSKFKQDCIGFF